jgi:hypothetical protein
MRKLSQKYSRLGISDFVVRGKFVFSSSTFRPVSDKSQSLGICICVRLLEYEQH